MRKQTLGVNKHCDAMFLYAFKYTNTFKKNMEMKNDVGNECTITMPKWKFLKLTVSILNMQF